MQDNTSLKWALLFKDKCLRNCWVYISCTWPYSPEIFPWY